MAPPLHFGTDGWRGIIAEEFTAENLVRVAQAHAQALLARGGQAVTVAHDTRFLGDRFADLSARTLQHAGLDVTLLTGPTPTPALSWAVRERGQAGGVMLTASHNPAIYQGYKLKGPYGGSATPELVAEVEAHLDRPVPPPAQSGTLTTGHIQAEYLEALSRQLDLGALRGRSEVVVHDAMHGAGAGWLAEFSGRYLGRQFVGLRDDPSPLFGGVHPEPVAANLDLTLSAMRERPALEFAVVTDGDADRVGAVQGGGILVNSHQIFALLLHHLASRGGRGRVVYTVSTSGLIRRLADYHGLPSLETPVGFKYITGAFLEGEADPAQAVLIGGEESGGIGVSGHLPERDGLLNGLLLLETVATTGLSLTEQFARLEDLTGWKHHYDRVDLHLPRPLDRSALLADVAGQRNIGGQRVTQVVTLDGVKLVTDGGFGMVRPSGTEPVVRLYAEASSDEGVRRILADLRTLTERHLG